MPKIKYEIIIVDYDSDDDITEYLKRDSFTVKIVHVRCEGLPVFNLSHARNIGANHANEKYLFFVDIDTVLSPGSMNFIANNINESNYLAAVDSQIRKEIVNGGLLAVSARTHSDIYGFNEDLTGLGFEDIDYKRRLEQRGLHFEIMPDSLYSCIDHPDLERIQCYTEDKELSWTKNRQIALQKWNNPKFGQWEDILVGNYGTN